MISAQTERAPGLAAKLARKARALASAHAENVVRARRLDGSRWREARLLWPLFGGEI